MSASSKFMEKKIKTLEIYLENYELKPKSRPRLSRSGGVYTPSASTEKNLANLLRVEAYREHGVVPCLSGSVFVFLSFKTTKKKLSGDGDNYEKLILDAMQKAGILENDKNVKACFWEKIEMANEKSLTIYAVAANEEKTFPDKARYFFNFFSTTAFCVEGIENEG